MMFRYPVLVVAMEVFYAFAWMSRKCMVLDEGSPYPGFSIRPPDYCPGNQLRVSCKDVSDFALDLSTVPIDIKALCVWVDHGSTLQPNALTKFHSLRSLYIHGCLSAILPETFKGLTNLHLLTMSCQECCNASVPSEVFKDLYNLEELKLENYALSKMAEDVFTRLTQLKAFDVKSDYTHNFSEILCKLTRLSGSLDSLSIEMNTETLEAPNCTYVPNQFPLVRKAIFLFPYVKKIGRNAFKYVKNVSVLQMPMNDVLSSQLLHSGIKQINRMDLCFTEVNIQSVCEVVLAMSVTNVNLLFNTVQEYSVSSWEKCYNLEIITLNGKYMKSIDLSFMASLKTLKIFNITSLVENSTLKADTSLMSVCKTSVSLSTLRHFSYRTSQNLTLRTRQFVCLSHLEGLYLAGGNIHLEKIVFEGLHHLQQLWLTSYSGHIGIEKSTFEGLNVLRMLQIQAIVSVLKPETFSHLVNAEELGLSGCRIQTIEDFAFKNLSQVRHINLVTNMISKISANTFFGLQNLETLILEKNPLRHLEPSSFSHFPSLRVLHLGNLKFSSTEHTGMEILNLSLIFGSFPRQLSDLTITSAVRPMTLAIADDSAPEVGLSLSLSGQKIVIWGCERPFLKSVTKLHVVTDFFLCAPDFTVAFDHFMSVDILQFTMLHASIVQNLSSLNRLVNMKRLDLGHVDFINTPGNSLIFKNLTKLESLSLSESWVDSLQEELSQDLTSLKYFFLNGVNTGVSLTTGFFEHLTSLRSAVIFEVKLRCTCDNVFFLDWARNQQQAGVFMFRFLGEPYRCISEGELQELDSYGQAHCRLDVGFVMYVSTSCFLLLFMTAVLLHQLARDYLLAFYHIANGWLNEVLHHQRNIRGRYLYDAFVSYSGKDEHWVVEELLPNLEQRGPPFPRLCLHSRDFQLGKDIVENITDSLYRSRRTICLISRHYLQSNWCSLEMRLATYRLQVEHRDVLILVFLEKIPSNLLSAHHRLARLIKTRTYIEWPQDPAQQEAFWDRLWKKLLSDRVE